MDFDGIPVKHERVVDRREGDETLVYSLLQSEISIINPLGSEIWELCDGSHNVQDILDVLIERYDVDLSVLKSDLIEFLEALQDRNLIYWR